MPCTSPLDAWPAPPGAADRRPVFSPFRSYEGAEPLRLPCGKCVGCKLDRARETSIRAVHEAQMHTAEGRGSIFVTYTFSDEHLPRDLSLNVKFVQRFHYRLRQEIGPFRFLLAGEYGSDLGRRPHYHAIIFGHDFRQDRYPWKRSSNGLLYRSPQLEKVWTYGHCLFSDFTMETAGYTARYTLKKVAGDRTDERYRREAIDPITGELKQWYVSPEFMLSSRRPGLGATWLEAFKSDVFPSDFVVINGQSHPVPRYYLNRLSEDEREAVRAKRKADRIRANAHFVSTADRIEEAKLSADQRAARDEGRRRLGARFSADNGDSRLLVKAESQAHRADRLLRPLDAGE